MTASALDLPSFCSSLLVVRRGVLAEGLLRDPGGRAGLGLAPLGEASACSSRSFMRFAA